LAFRDKIAIFILDGSMMVNNLPDFAAPDPSAPELAACGAARAADGVAIGPMSCVHRSSERWDIVDVVGNV
jgi:hypothetical protein